MASFEIAVQLIANEYKEECATMDCTIKELFKCWQLDNEDMLEEFWSILNEKFDGCFTDECEIIEGDEVKTFAQLVKAVKNYQF